MKLKNQQHPAHPATSTAKLPRNKPFLGKILTGTHGFSPWNTNVLTLTLPLNQPTNKLQEIGELGAVYLSINTPAAPQASVIFCLLLGAATPSEEWTPSEYCNQTSKDHPQGGHIAMGKIFTKWLGRPKPSSNRPWVFLYGQLIKPVLRYLLLNHLCHVLTCLQ